jgi:hypothetical protein
MKGCQYAAYRAYQPLHTLHTPFMLFHTLLQLRQSPRLPDPKQLIDLVLHYTQVRQDLSLKLRHLSLPFCCHN